MPRLDAGALVIGGGPAGSSFAIRLAQLGHHVVLVERDPFPRLHVGEAFAAGIHVPLSRLGIDLARDPARVLRTDRLLRVWDTAEVEETSPATGSPGVSVDRGWLDRLLLDRARALGVRVIQPAAVVSCKRTSVGWTICARSGRARLQIDARYVADASGRSRVMPGVVRAEGPQTSAHVGYWRLRGADPMSAVNRLEATADGWLWAAPLPGRRAVAMAFCDRDRGEMGTRRERYIGLLRASALLGPLAAAGRLESFIVRDATCRAADDTIGENWIRLGEASFSIDPLSSSGVQKAIQTALTGALVAHTQLTRPERGDAAIRFYRDDVRWARAQHAAWSGSAYARVGRFRGRPFWSRRARPDDAWGAASKSQPMRWSCGRLRLSPNARLVLTPCVVGDLIETQLALAHPRLERPVAFLGDVAIAPIVEAIGPGVTPDALLARWSPQVAPATGRAVVQWLFDREILVASDE